MKEETRRWWGRCQEDLETAKILIENSRLREGAFFLQQSIEKALKSLLIETEDDFPRIHDLVSLGRRVGVPDQLLEICRGSPAFEVWKPHGCMGKVRSGTVISLFLVALAMPGSLGKEDPASGHIRIIGIGESYYPETRFPHLIMADPRIRYQPIPANWYEGSFEGIGTGRNDVLRFIRQYMPKTYERFVDGFDVVFLSDFEVDVITPQQFMWMEKGVREEGMGLGKYEMNWDSAYFSTFDLFVSSAVYPVFPASLVRGSKIPNTLGGIEPVPLNLSGRPPGAPHPVVDLPGMRNYKILTSGTYGYETPREGAITIARFVPDGQDAIIIRPYGEGHSLTCLPGLDKIDATSITQWPFTVDFWINQMWYLAGVAIPDDIQLVHQLRSDSLTYFSEKGLAISVIQFVEKFGAPTMDLYQMMAESDDLKKESDVLYMEERFTESLDKLREAFDGLLKLAERSMEAKDAALFWVYAIEWLAVTGTFTIVGFALWTLMVRRRLYREVSVTRTG